jgi:hypothetical protein
MRVFKEFKKLSLYLQTELIVKYGYESETHKVETPDGYILEMHRMTWTWTVYKAGVVKRNMT